MKKLELQAIPKSRKTQIHPAPHIHLGFRPEALFPKVPQSSCIFLGSQCSYRFRSFAPRGLGPFRALLPKEGLLWRPQQACVGGHSRPVAQAKGGPHPALDKGPGPYIRAPGPYIRALGPNIRPRGLSEACRRPAGASRSRPGQAGASRGRPRQAQAGELLIKSR